MYDVLIKNGTILDGTGKKAKYTADIGIAGGVIVSIGSLGDAQAKKIIDASGLFVAPGFIDVLSHSDTYLTLLTNPLQESLVSQGITTIIGGNCGYSLAPLVSGAMMDSQKRWGNTAQINIDWLRMAEFLDRIEGKKLNVNFGTLTGYNTVVKGVVHSEHVELTVQQNEIVAFLVDQAQFEGSFGVSLGLQYLRHTNSFESNLDHIFSILKKHNKIATVHLQDESDRFLDALSSILHTAKEHDVALHISHLKVMGRHHWSNFKEAILLIEKAYNEGMRVSFDIFPYASSGLELYFLLPHWAKDGGHDDIMKRLANSIERKQIIKDITARNFEYDKMIVASNAPDTVFIGKTISEIARNLGVSPEEAVVELLLGSQLSVIVFAHVLDEANVQMAVAHPLSVIASSGAGYSAAQLDQTGLPHPRSFGAFPRFLKKYVREKHLLSWEQAIAKITGDPARIFGIRNKGKIQTDFAGDIVIFNPQLIADVATFQNPYQYSKGIHTVLTNGVMTFQDGKVLPAFPGTVLYGF